MRRMIRSLINEQVTKAINRPFYEREGSLEPIEAPNEVWPFIEGSFRQDASLATEIAIPTLRLGQDPVYPCPWHLERHMAAFQEHGEGRKRGVWEFDDYDHQVIWYEPLGLGFVEKGNHSIAQGILAHEGEVTCRDAYDISEIFRRYETNGLHYFQTGSDTPIAEVEDIGWASIFHATAWLVAWLDHQKRLAAGKDVR